MVQFWTHTVPAHSSDMVLLLVHAGFLMVVDYTEGTYHLKLPRRGESV